MTATNTRTPFARPIVISETEDELLKELDTSYPVTTADLAAVMNFSETTIRVHLNRLRRYGYVIRSKHNYSTGGFCYMWVKKG